MRHAQIVLTRVKGPDDIESGPIGMPPERGPGDGRVRFTAIC